MMFHYAGIDDRVNATAPGWVDALEQAGVPVRAYTYEGANHAFHNDTSAARYDPTAARLAWDRSIAFFADDDHRLERLPQHRDLAAHGGIAAARAGDNDQDTDNQPHGAPTRVKTADRKSVG